MLKIEPHHEDEILVKILFRRFFRVAKCHSKSVFDSADKLLEGLNSISTIFSALPENKRRNSAVNKNDTETIATEQTIIATAEIKPRRTSKNIVLTTIPQKHKIFCTAFFQKSAVPEWHSKFVEVFYKDKAIPQ